MQIDNPHVRNAPDCPLCRGPKPVGNVTCWPCYRQAGMKYGNPKVEALIARREQWLCNR